MSVKERLQAVQARVAPHQGLLLSHPADITYLSDFEILVPTEREALLVVTSERAYLLHASFSPFNAVAGITPLIGAHVAKLKANLGQIIEQEQLTQLSYDPQTLFVSELQELEKLEAIQLEAANLAWLRNLRAVKDQEELTRMRTAAQLTAQALEQTLTHLTAGLTEREVKQLLEHNLRQAGLDQVAFPTIVAFGEHSALPHHQPTARPLEPETVVLIDVGGKYQGYCADMTRTIWFGSEPSELFQTIQEVVQRAYQAVITRLQQPAVEHAPLLLKDLDEAARTVISHAGYAEQFIHTTGHGIGLEIHEYPSINWNNADPVKPGMVVTVEPGIYLEGQFGYRYENTVVIGQQQVEELTLVSK